MLEQLVLCKNSGPEVVTSLFQQRMCPKGKCNPGLQCFEAPWLCLCRGQPCLPCGALQELGCNPAGGGRSTHWEQWGWVPPVSPGHAAALRASQPQASGSEQEQQELAEEGDWC